MSRKPAAQRTAARKAAVARKKAAARKAAAARELAARTEVAKKLIVDNVSVQRPNGDVVPIRTLPQREIARITGLSPAAIRKIFQSRGFFRKDRRGEGGLTADFFGLSLAKKKQVILRMLESKMAASQVRRTRDVLEIEAERIQEEAEKLAKRIERITRQLGEARAKRQKARARKLALSREKLNKELIKLNNFAVFLENALEGLNR